VEGKGWFLGGFEGASAGTRNRGKYGGSGFPGSGPLRASLVFDPPKIDRLQSGILLPADPLQFAGLAQR
jgi:hypothetical protein